jgi:basic membrane protein A and related proteins
VHRSASRAIAIALSLAVGALGVAACGSSNDKSSGGSSSSSSSSASTAQGKKIKVGLVTDIGGLNDRSFNQLANQGLQRAIKQLGVDGRVLISKQNSDYIPNLTTLASQKYDLIIGNGFLMADAVATVAKKFPQEKFAIIDFNAAAMKGKPQNVVGLPFKEQEAGYLVGYLTALYAKDNGGSLGSVGGQKIPPVDHYIAGFEAGAKKADPSVKTLNGYSQSFTDQAKCKEIALDQIAKGAKVVFQVAGSCGLGAIDAAKEKGVQAIGVDADQSYLGGEVITSALKKVDVAVFNAIKSVQDNTYKGGTDSVSDLDNNGVGIGKISAAGQKYAAKIPTIEDQIKSGQITPPDTVGGAT